MNPNFFRRRHPLVTSCYYVVMLLIAMSTTNPLIISCCFLGSLSFQLLHLKKGEKHSIIYPLIFLILITITNPLFVHRGGTILFFFLSKPITLEAFVYGFFMGMMIASILYLFQNFQTTVDSEKFFYLFGKRFPKSALILTMIFRFIPLFQVYYQELNQVQKTIQLTQKRKLTEKASYGLDLFGNLFSWALENAMDTADSMKARGYGVTARSSRTVYRWKNMDLFSLFVILSLGSFFIISGTQGDYQFNFYPYSENLLLLLKQRWLDYLMIFVLALLPTLNRIREVIVWTILKSRI
ncbi:energy-coupling factor transporter transmembrane component T [Enterococcus ureasiticus]|uniref:Cobalt ABC transporter permease n=1 Tax=Enterococcus ureasiticus TaxID=903984 RepID=A0A1E5GMD7_9ENTE|nr:energy-coupling factor transporter transmembrane component T [Enterococcus ureasiticus]OEG13869.1 hypothetical protein BCR21_02440 [Enterococcus ureasiticus]